MGKNKRPNGEENQPRKKNFNDREKERIVAGLEARLGLVNRDLGIGKTYKTNEEMAKAWEEIAKEVSAVGMGAIRSGPEIRAKWSDLKSTVKRKAQEILKSQKRTGGGPGSGEELTPLELRVVQLIGETAIHGIAGSDRRVDTMALNTQAKKQKAVSATATRAHVSYTPPRDTCTLTFTGTPNAGRFRVTPKFTPPSVGARGDASQFDEPEKGQSRESFFENLIKDMGIVKLANFRPITSITSITFPYTDATAAENPLPPRPTATDIPIPPKLPKRIHKKRSPTPAVRTQTIPASDELDNVAQSVVNNQEKLNGILGSILDEMVIQREQNTQFLVALSNHFSNTNNILLGIHNALVSEENKIDTSSLCPGS